MELGIALALRERLKEQYELNREILARLGFNDPDGIQSFRSITRLASAAIETSDSNVLVVVPSVRTTPLYSTMHGMPSLFSRVSSLEGFSVRRWGGNSFTVPKSIDPIHDRGIKVPFYAGVALNGFAEGNKAKPLWTKQNFMSQLTSQALFEEITGVPVKSFTAAQYIMLNLLRAEAGLDLLDTDGSYTRLYHYPPVHTGLEARVPCINTTSDGQFNINEFDGLLRLENAGVRLVEDIPPSRPRN